MTAFAPTEEQLRALLIFGTGQSLAIEAGAGTGKTSTLILLAESTDRLIQYVAFNKAIVSEAGQKMPRNVRCNTAHSLAFKAVGINYRNRLDSSQRMKSWDIARILGLDPINVTTFLGNKKQLSPSFLAGIVMRGISRFCQTADPQPTWRHIPMIDGLDDPNPPTGTRSYAVNNYVARGLESALRTAWADLSRTDGSLRFEHDHYLKLWQLSGPRIEADVILFDEAQDANPVMVAIVAAQTHAQLVWVGDSQQQIYTFTGAVNALANVPAENKAFLTQSFRFGPAVADVANDILGTLNAQLRLTGTTAIDSTVEAVADPLAILTRTNAVAVRTVLAEIRQGGKPHLVGGGSEIASFARAASNLMSGRRTEHRDLACFETWGEVQEYVAHDELGSELRLMVNLVDEFGVEVILEALDHTSPESSATVVVSTAHKSKGREWSTVRLGGDFPDQPGEEELRLLYVAVTRAKLTLDITQVGYLSPADAGEGTTAKQEVTVDA